MEDQVFKFINDVYDIVLPLIIGGLVGFIVARSKKYKTNTESLRNGILALLRIQLINAYDDYVVNRIPMSLERRDIIEKAYDSYKGLGGNGSIDHMFDMIKQVDPFIVGQDTHND